MISDVSYDDRLFFGLSGSYGTDLTKFEEFFKSVDEEVDFTTVDADVIRSWVVNLMDGGYTSTSVNRKLSSLRSVNHNLLRRRSL